MIRTLVKTLPLFYNPPISAAAAATGRISSFSLFPTSSTTSNFFVIISRCSSSSSSSKVAEESAKTKQPPKPRIISVYSTPAIEAKRRRLSAEPSLYRKLRAKLGYVARPKTPRVFIHPPDDKPSPRILAQAPARQQEDEKMASNTNINQAPKTSGDADKIPKGGEAKFTRLPEDVYPINYNLRLQPYLQDFRFNGELVIDVEIRKSTKEIVLDACDIVVKKASVAVIMEDKQQSAKQDVDKIEYFKKPIERVRLTFADALPKGKMAQVFITYEGVLQEKMYGFYRNKYTSADGKGEKWGATTQMEACHARKCLPCWDEPALKATFDCTLVVPKDLCALGNMPIKHEREVKVMEHGQETEWKAITYERTPKMSTYLLAFCIGEYDYVEGQTSNGTLVRVYTPKGKAHQGKFSLDFTLKTLPYYEAFFDQRFPLPKCDLVAIENFAMGAMENWGLITFRETAVLIDPSKSSAAARQRVALVVGHELAHMWFGNLVTMEWWTDLWLNEGFATFVEHLSIENSFPEWQIWKQFVEDIVISAMHLDALESTHPIQVTVNHPDEVEEIFDQISYEKGASIIRMLYMYLGHDGFRRGLAQYLAAFKYRNAKTSDLWEYLEKANSDKPVSKVMSDWTTKIGFPYLKAELEQHNNKSGNAGDAKLKLTQHRFTFLPHKGKSEMWNIPITVQIGGGNNGQQKIINTLMKQNEHETINLPAAEYPQISNHATPIVVNVGRTGFYRVAYSADLQTRLIEGIRTKQVAAVDRLAIQNDQYALARAGIQPLAAYLQLINDAYVQYEDDAVVWQAIVAHLGGIQTLLENTPLITQYKTFVRHALKPIQEKLQWEPQGQQEPHLNTMLREQVLLRMVRAEHAQHVEHAYSMLKDGQALQPELRHPVFSAAALKGKEGYELLRQLYAKSDLQEERVRVLANMGFTYDLDILNQLHEWSLDGSGAVRPQDLIILYAGCTQRPQNRDATWSFLQQNWERFMKVTPESLVARTVNSIVSAMVDEREITKVEAFFAAHPLEQGRRAIQQACEKCRINQQMLKRDLASTEKWLMETVGGQQ